MHHNLLPPSLQSSYWIVTASLRAYLVWYVCNAAPLIIVSCLPKKNSHHYSGTIMNEIGNTTNADPVLENEELVELPHLVEVAHLHHMNNNLVNVSKQTHTLNQPLNTTKAYSGKEMELI